MKIAALALLFAPAILAAQTPRDVAAPAPAGNGVISGVVVSDDASATPVKRAVIAVTTSEQRGDRRTVTDDHGRFSIGQLPAGHYTISATKAGWLTAYYGSSHPGRPAFGGATLAITSGEQAAPITLKLLRGSVVTGTITDSYGRPASGMEMELATVRMQDGERRIATQNFTGVQGSVNAETDDRGVYRFYGIVPGEYVVLAMPSFFDFGNSEVLQLTPDALAAAKRSVVSAIPGGASSGVSNAPSSPAPRPPTIGAAPVFFPGTVDIAAATLLRIGPNDERSGVDFTVQLIPTSRVEGVVTGPDSQPVAGAFVQLVPPGNDMAMFFGGSSTRTGPDGHFKFVGVQPGRYEIVARASDPTNVGRGGGAAGGGFFVSSATVSGGGVMIYNDIGPGPGGYALWGSDTLTVAGDDISSLSLTLQRGATVSGHVVFTGASLQAPQDLSRTRVMLQPAAGNARMSLGPVNGVADASGVFHIPNVPPGRYRVAVTIVPAGRGARGGGRGVAVGPGAGADMSSAAWLLRSAMSGDVDAIDHPMDIAVGTSPPDLTVTFTDHLSEISGAVKKSGQPVGDYRIVVFSADKSLWGLTNRRMHAPIQTERDGTFRVENLPAGNYFLALVTDMEPDDFTNAAFLEDLAKSAIPITLADGEKKVQNINIK